MTNHSLSDMDVAPREVQELLARREAVLFVDVREPWEHDVARIEGAVLIPLRQIPANLTRLSRERDVILFCHHGVRSLDAAAWLRAQRVEGARSMSGGIDRWAAEIDPRVPRY